MKRFKQREIYRKSDKEPYLFFSQKQVNKTADLY